MPQIYVCFLWHMHQPFYKDLLSQEYKLPWTRLHGLKDYYGMVKVLQDFPHVHQTFNLVPSLLVQIEEYAAGRASDPFLRAALEPAEAMDESQLAFLRRYSFQANPARLIYRFPRYAELYERRQAPSWTVQDYRDLQVLSQLAWFEEEWLETDPEISGLAGKGRQYTFADQQLIGRKQVELLGRVIGAYREFAARGQIEISTTPFYHPILPLLCDSDIAAVSHHGVSLPQRFAYPEDARHQLLTGRSYIEDTFGCAPAGLWPSEGSVSDQMLRLASECGFRWFASDNGVLGRALKAAPDPRLTYRPYLWSPGGPEMRCIFRDHVLSDLIGFVYAGMDAREAAADLLGRIRQNCASILAEGRDALAPIILDGENAWEYYERNGRPFLRELYGRLQEADDMTALTVSEALERMEPEPIASIHPGSWIDANFDIWIGAEEDNRAWELLLAARRAYEREGHTVPAERRKLAFESLLIAEGSDWCWWYGPEHESANRPEFDELFRSHLANVYRTLGLDAPEALSRPILRVQMQAYHHPPTGPVTATIDGEITSYFEWLGAGTYRLDQRSGAMHAHRPAVREVYYGADQEFLYLRLDFTSPPGNAEVRVNLDQQSATFRLSERGQDVVYGKVFEVRLPLARRFQLSLWQDGLPAGAFPAEGWFELSDNDW